MYLKFSCWVLWIIFIPSKIECKYLVACIYWEQDFVIYPRSSFYFYYETMQLNVYIGEKGSDNSLSNPRDECVWNIKTITPSFKLETRHCNHRSAACWRFHCQTQYQSHSRFHHFFRPRRPGSGLPWGHHLGFRPVWEGMGDSLPTCHARPEMSAGETRQGKVKKHSSHGAHAARGHLRLKTMKLVRVKLLPWDRRLAHHTVNSCGLSLVAFWVD